MGRQPCCDKVGLKKGPWTADEDKKLINFILTNGQCCWRAVPKLAGLLRCGKSCRLRWTNYLRPDLKRGLLSEYEEKIVIDLHAQLGNRWSKIASHLPGRTDNEIKNHWNTHIKKKLKKLGIDPVTHKPFSPSEIQQSQNSRQKRISQQKQEHPSSDLNEEKVLSETQQSQDSGAAAEPEMNNGFCTEEIPLIDMEGFGLPCNYSAASSSSSSSSSCDSSKFFEDIHFPDFDWPTLDYENSAGTNNNNNDVMSWWDDDFASWDLFVDDDPDFRGSKIGSDQESWSFGLF